MTRDEQPEPGGCRSFMAGGCLLGVAGFALAAAAFLLAMFLLLWLIQFVWSLF